ncbi:3-dehydroquinate dehydratase [Salinarchaeum sp. Harcht-Bsk1]|uniref:type I 3-dehydroquinate dehydratase n=1 Tax=Salinarchaeum sp. Harcht-Bsk1 TaxID=1333523 RepID=UPI0003423F7B|nr:type I 3-dehydroquinate dehydratase [Salinarchaeum sp. Harcht-Bsk1]AGN00202.1 3-dehydroquinate dehydratase [Salinarchaeum sp. Harcht-Bsk1]
MDFSEFVLTASTADLSDATHPAAREHADAVEFRMDLAADPLSLLDAYDGALPILATNRVEWEGGQAPDDESRLDDLVRAAEYDAVEAIDVELEAMRRGGATSVPDRVGDDVTIVASVHDFDRTPSMDDLRSLARQTTEYGDVGKVVPTAESVDDVPPLLTVTREFCAQGRPIATMAMGEPGRHSRAVAPLYGSRIGYAPVDPNDATAPGQYDVATLAELVARLEAKPEA